MSEEKFGKNVLDWVNANSKKIMIGLVVLALCCLTAVAGVAWYLYSNNTDVIAIVGEEKITTQDLDKKIYGRSMNGDMNISTEEKNLLIDVLIEESIVRQYASKNNITVTDEEALERAKADSKNYDTVSQANQTAILEQAKRNVLLDKVTDRVVTWKQGQYIKIHFDRHFAIADSLTSEERALLKTTQEADIKADREYADKLKDSIYADIKSGKLTFEQAMEAVRNDKFIDYTAWDFTVGNPGVNFDTKGAPKGASLLENDAFKSVLSATGKGEIVEPFVMKLDYGDWRKNEVKLVDSQWVILRVTDEYKGDANSYESWLNQQKIALGAKKRKEGLKLLDIFMGEVYAWSNPECLAGRTNLGSSHPGDLITDARRINADGTNVPMSNVYSYVKTGPGAYAYTGCPLTSGYTINGVSGFSASEISNSAGCMYYFSKLGSFNLCCSGSHNPHYFAVGYSGTMDTYGHWWAFYQGTTDGSAWGGPYTSGFATGYGVRYSGHTNTFSIINGDTVYRRAYWVVDAPPVTNYTLTVNTSPSGAATVTGAGTYASGSTATAGYTNVGGGYSFVNWTGDAGCGSAMTMNGNKSCTANFTYTPPTISCTVSPQSGLSPLVVMVEAQVLNPVSGVTYTFNYNMGDGSAIATNRTSPMYYTYPADAVGDMNITVTSNNIPGFTCPCTTTIQTPSDSDGGEVNP